ncbi:hypothetical protein LTR64_000860 [Lithohypha guttulata]|uniref:uncharacterized protein n=1 Tax=Lithohypha guttulata TaxID=1690604 RepID=UPI002DDF6613|nr:hypothetical protein LTR51_003054 [Lithohypha guttulata]
MASSAEDIAWLKSTFHPIPRPALPDDCIEYSLYVVDPALDRANESEVKIQLRNIQKYANDLQKQWLKDYIWQRQSFNLEMLKDNGEVCVLNRKDNEERSNAALGVNFLRGRTEYGDSIEDEWVIVWLLRELTKKFSNSWVKVTDSDGEFLLIEASGTLPAWLEPEVAENRVWVNAGQLKILKPAGVLRSSKRTDERLSFEGAHQIILSEPKRVMHSVSMGEEAFYRLRNYPAQIKENMHHAILTLPRKVAYLLLQKAAYVAPAVEAFYLRDPISLKPLRAEDAADKMIFSPQDMVDFSITIPRVAYAQLRSQDSPILDIWKSKMPPPSEAVARVQTETGMKLAIGFEILLSDKQYQDRTQVREMKLLLEDIESGDAAVPTDEELGKLEKRSDSEQWLDINFEDLQRELNPGKSNDPGQSGRAKKATFGDHTAQENLQRIVKQFESFLNEDDDHKGSGFLDEDEDENDTDDLDDIDSDDLEEDKDASFDDDDLTNLMQEMMGMPADAMREIMHGDIDALKNGAQPQAPLVPSTAVAADTEDTDSNSDEEQPGQERDLEELVRRMDAELKASGALNLDEAEASSSRAVTGHNINTEEDDSSDDDDDDESPLDPEKERIAKQLLESLQAQGGASGPAANLMALMAEQYAEADRRKAEIKGKSKF